MDAKDLILSRRSVRKYTDEKVSKEILLEIMEMAKFAPSWKNYQIARYTFVEDIAVLERLANEGVNEFVYNANTLKYTKGALILSFVKGQSGKFDVETDEYVTSKSADWEVFDAGIACQNFCLAAHAKGVGTCIMGVIDDTKIAEIVNLPANETVAALITYGYPAQKVEPTPRKDVDELARFI